MSAALLSAAILAACGGSDGSPDDSTTDVVVVNDALSSTQRVRNRNRQTTTTTVATTTTTTIATTTPSTSTTSTTTTTAAATGTGWSQCALEYGTCAFSGTRSVKYGTTTSAVVKTFANGVGCNNANFGDPAPGAEKVCWSEVTAATSTATTPVTTPVTTTTTTGTTTTTPTMTTTPANTSTAVASGPTTSATFTSSSANFPNPERGWYVSPKDGEMTASTLSSFVNDWNTRLFLYRIPLDNYRSSALPQSFLDTLNTRFAAGRAAGVKFIVQATYNYDSSGSDAPLSLVLQHIAQLKPVLAQNADVIPFMKAGFVGAYGEWWGSTNGLDASDSSRAAIKDALLANTPASTIVHFTASSDFAKWYPNAPSTAASARVGFHNDCYLANDTDAHQFAGLSDPMRDYVKTMTQNTGFGGETCDNVSNPEQRRISCAQAISEGAAYHQTWLNAGYAQVFIDSWKSGGCYSQIGSLMGYRLQLDSVNHVTTAARGTTIAVNVNLRNVGWARMFSKRPLVVTLRNKSTGATITGSAGDLSSVSAGASAQIAVNVSIPSGAAVGNYDVQISAPDIWSTTASDARFAVRFGNADSGSQAWDASTGRFTTATTLSVQ